MGLMDILQQYAGGATPQGNVDDHFDQAVQHASPADLGSGIAAALRSDATPPFGQMISGMFGRSNGQQQAGVLNQLIQALGPAALSSVAGGVLGRVLGGGGGGIAGSGMPTTITPEQASQLSPSDVTTIAAHAEKQDPSIVDRMGSFYAQHPTLVKSLGATALAIALGNMRRQN